LISTAVDPKNSQLAVVVFVLISCMLGGADPSLAKLSDMGFVVECIYSCSFARWTMEGMYVANMNRWPDIWEEWRANNIARIGYNKDNFSLDCWMLIVIGSVARVLSCCTLFVVNRGAQT
jgi:hypothetical protein